MVRRIFEFQQPQQSKLRMEKLMSVQNALNVARLFRNNRHLQSSPLVLSFTMHWSGLSFNAKYGHHQYK